MSMNSGPRGDGVLAPLKKATLRMRIIKDEVFAAYGAVTTDPGGSFLRKGSPKPLLKLFGKGQVKPFFQKKVSPGISRQPHIVPRIISGEQI